jgi:hypothetical protein
MGPGKQRTKTSLALWLGLALGAAVGAPANAQTWSQLEQTGPPPVRISNSAVFDDSQNQMIVFGGYNGFTGSYFNDVWSLSLGASAWVQVSPTGTPPAGEWGHSAVYDAVNSRMIVFGGSSPAANNNLFVLSNANGVNGRPAWTQLAPAGTLPAARYLHNGVYDATNNRMIVFGGTNDESVTDFNDVWVLSNANGLGGTPQWSALSAIGGPPPARDSASGVYDAGNNRLIVFGGYNGSTSSYFNDVWVLSNANGLSGAPTWTELAPVGSVPPARGGAGAIFVPTTDQMAIFGGFGACGAGSIFCSDVWTLGGANGLEGTPAWTQLFAAGGPSARNLGNNSSVYDSLAGEMIVFGGYGPGPPAAYLNDTWALYEASWVNGLPDLTISKSHSGNFVQGDSGDTYTIIVTNSGSGPTSGTVTVVDTLPTGLTATSITGGATWNCTLATLTCTATSPLAAGQSYPAIALTVNVASNAPVSVSNMALVSGGGETNTTNNTATDLTTIGWQTPGFTTYTYRGNAFTNAQSPYTTSDSITGYFTSSTLAANLNAVNITSNILAYSFTDGGVNTITSAQIPPNRIVVSTDSQGNITSWDVTLILGSPPTNVALFTCSGITTYFNSCPSGPFDESYEQNGSGPSGDNNSDPGRWSVASPPATVLVAAPNTSGSYYGMCCNGNDSSAGEFTLSGGEYVTTIDVVLLGSSIYDFSLQNSLTGSITTFASAVITAPATGPNTEAMTVNATLPAGTYYLVGTEDPASTLHAPGWYVSDGTFVTYAGTVTNGVWSSSSGPTGPFSFLSGLANGYTYDAPVFIVNGFPLSGPISQTITFSAFSNVPLGTAPFTITATASSGLAVSFASTTASVCTVSGSTVTIITVGTCSITASQAGNANYVAATPVTQSFTINLATSFTLSSTAANFSSSGGNGSAAVMVVPGNSTAPWGVVSNSSWIAITNPANGCATGNGAIDYSVSTNAGAIREGTFSLLAGCPGSASATSVGTFTVTQQTPSSCTLSVSPIAFTFAAGTGAGPAGTGTVNLNVPPCSSWSANSNAAWVTFANGGQSASGTSASFTFNVGVNNTGQPRSAVITVGSQSIAVTQNPQTCAYSIATHPGSNANFLAAGGAGIIDVNTIPAAGCSWAPTSNNSFLIVTGTAPSPGTGAGTVSYAVAPNSSSVALTGTITVAGLPYVISQAAAGPQSYSCTIAQPIARTLRQEGLAELLGDLVLNCSGTSSGGVTGDVIVTLNANITNHTLTADPSGLTTDALLLKDEPASQALVLASNVFRGVVAGPYSIRFPAVLLAPETGSFSHTLRITNLRVNANQSTTLSPQVFTVTASVAIAGAPFTVPSAAQTLGTIAASSGFSSPGPPTAGGPGGSSNWPVTFTEQLADAYRPALASGQNPSQVAVSYASESGYVNSQILGTETGFATNGTRLVARFADVPCGVSVYAPVAPAAGSNAKLVSADGNGAGGFPVVSSVQIGSTTVPGYQQVLLTSAGGPCSNTGSGTATWEVTSTLANSPSSLMFSVLVYNPGNASLSGMQVSGAPGPQQTVSSPSSTASVPRFVNPTVAAPAQVIRLNIAPVQTAVQSGSTSSSRTPAMAVSVRRDGAPVPNVAGGSGNTVTVGGTVTIGELLLSDANSPPATNACVGTTLPPSYTITSCSGGSGSTCTQIGSNQVSTCYPTFDPGQSSMITVSADTSAISGTVGIDSSAISDQGNFGSGSFSQAVTVSPGAAIALEFAGIPTVVAGLQIAYSVNLNNSGSGAKLQGDPLTVTITPDSRLTNVCQGQGTGGAWVCAPSCSNSGTPMVCTDLSAVPANGGSTSLTVTGIVPQGAGGTVSTSATLTLGGQVSAVQYATTSVISTPPPAVTALSPVPGATGVSPAASLIWGPVSGAASYNVYFGASTPPPLVTSTSGIGYSPTMIPSTTYYWSVTAVNALGSTPSAVWSFTTASPTACSFGLTPAYTSLSATGTSTVEACPNNSGQPNCGIAPEVPLTFTVTPTAACGAWTATSSNPGDLQLTSGASGSGVGTVGFTAVNNTHTGQQSYNITVASAAGSATYPVIEAGSGDSEGYREIYALYEQLLGRDPDPAGFAFWSGAGAAGLGQMADSFLTSPEAFNSDFAVMAAYQAATGAPPTYAQFTAAVASVRAGTQTVGGLFNALIGSGFTAAILYQNLLNRAPAGADSSCIATGLDACFQTIIGYPSNTTPVGATNNEFQSTGTYRTADHTNALYVQMIYYVTVSRDPDAAGLTFWIGVANGGGPGVLFQGSAGYRTRIQILGPGTPNQGFIGSPEFQGLFAN